MEGEGEEERERGGREKKNKIPTLREGRKKRRERGNIYIILFVTLSPLSVEPKWANVPAKHNMFMYMYNPCF